MTLSWAEFFEFAIYYSAIVGIWTGLSLLFQFWNYRRMAKKYAGLDAAAVLAAALGKK